VTAGRVHHSAIQVGDVEASLRFYRDGIGLDVLMDHVFEGDWPALFGAPSAVLRSIFLGDRTHPDVGIVELVVFDGPDPVAARADPVTEQTDPDRAAPAGPAPASVSGPGFFLLSFYVDVDEVLARLAGLGFGPARRIEQPAPTGAVTMACVYDPDGVRVELVGVPAASGETVPTASG
jgi:catechol 2,3-dioxygenase-like lactoylglutathione lyase family enzyme